MTIKAAKFTPEVLLEAPRRSVGAPNSDASKVLYSVSTYSFAEHAKKSEIRLLCAHSQQSTLITDDASASEANWIDDQTIIYLNSEKDGTTSIVVGDPSNFDSSKHVAGTIDGPVGDLKVIDLGDGDFGFAVSGKAKPDGSIFNPEKVVKPPSSGRLYTSGFVRHWDHYTDNNRNTVFLGKLQRQDDGKFQLNGGLKNALEGEKLESPIEPFGGKDHFDISQYGLVFTSKDPNLNPALHTKTNIYVAGSESFWQDSSFFANGLFIQKVTNDGFNGASSNPVWSNSGKMIAFLAMRTDGYESDKNQPFIIHDYAWPSDLTPLFPSNDGMGTWDRSPSSIAWSRDDWHLYFTAEENGCSSLYSAGPPTAENGSSPLPRMIVKGGSISAAQVLENGDIFLTSTSLIENSLYSLVPLSKYAALNETYTLPTHDGSDADASPTLTTTLISSNSRFGSMFGLSRRQIDSITFKGYQTDVHAWVVKPSDFDSNKTYPLAYLIHGGPQGAWLDSWSTRWNPAVFAEQGYVVVCPNPTGSTGYGQDFVDAIKNNWGGAPYYDIVAGFDFIAENMEYVDTKRAVALGASYGGYMMNWIQGHDLGRAFKALVTHDGVFSMTGQLASEELYFPFHDLGGALWKKPDDWAKWDPSRHTDKWATPHLIVHSELDYRLTVAEGLAAFNVLQAKGVESEYLTFPDENHWVLKPENSLVWHEVVLDWINRHVGLERYTARRARERQVMSVEPRYVDDGEAESWWS